MASFSKELDQIKIVIVDILARPEHVGRKRPEGRLLGSETARNWAARHLLRRGDSLQAWPVDNRRSQRLLGLARSSAVKNHRAVTPEKLEAHNAIFT